MSRAPIILTPSTRSIRVVVDGTKVALIAGGRLVTTMPWEAALQLATALQQVARLAEEQDKALQIASDNAALLNLGLPIGLTDRRDIQQESVRLAQSMPGGIKSQSVVGAPALIRHPAPKREEQ